MSSTSKSSSVKNHWKSFVTSLLTPSILFRNMSAAAVLAVLNVATAVSIGTLIFSGPLKSFVSLGIGLFLIATAVAGLIIPATSGYKGLIAAPRSGQAPVFAVMAATIALSMQGQPNETIAVTVIAAILVTTLIVGIFMFTIGLAKMGTLVRYIPYPVVAGFFAGLGYLLTKGGITVAAGPLADITSLTSFLTAEVTIHLLPAVLFGVVLLLMEQRFSHWLLFPTILAADIGLFYFILFATGTSIETATQNGWVSAFDKSTASFFPVFSLGQVPAVDWSVVAQQFSTVIVLCILSVIMLLLDISGVEIAINRDLDPNRELRTAGLSNIIGAFVVSPLSFGVAADTAVAHKLGGDRFIMIVIYTALILTVIAVGPAPISLIPSAIVGGFLIYIGLNFLIEWIWKKRSKLPFTDLLVIFIILAGVAVLGILEGVAIGIFMATVLFVHSYSQLSVVKSAMDGAEHVSNIDRHKNEQAYLDQHGELIQIFVLQGFVFFGSANQLLEKIKLIINGDRANKRFLVIDFNHVDGVDSSVTNSFAKLMKICIRENITLCLTGKNTAIIERIANVGEELKLSTNVLQIFRELDEAIGWCEDQILLKFSAGNSSNQVMNSDELLNDLIEDDEAVATISKYFKKETILEGEVLFKQGDTGNSLYLILGGAISIVINLPGAHSVTVRTMRAGSILGEMAVYTGAPRTASAVARRDSVLFKLSTKDYQSLVLSQPSEAHLFSACIIKIMAERLARSNKSVLALAR